MAGARLGAAGGHTPASVTDKALNQLQGFCAPRTRAAAAQHIKPYFGARLLVRIKVKTDSEEPDIGWGG